jgi:murein DD-endopeptidase MepM/ murein hydrolase activator NlpD
LKLDRKTITFLIVSNRSGKTKKYVFPLAWLKTATVVGAIAAIACSMAVVDYAGLLVQSVQVKRLKADNARLESQFQLVEGKLNALEKGLERIKNFSTKLRMITNIEDPERSLKLAVGPVGTPDRAIEQIQVPIDDRGPAAEVAEQDAPFFETPPLDIARGELAAEKGRDFASLSIRIDEAVREVGLREQNILELWEGLSGRQSVLRATPSVRPTRGWYTSRFGYRVNPLSGSAVMHQGLDIAAAPGTPVYAPADGVVSFAGYDSGYGKLVSVDHGYGVVTRFGHNSKVFVAVGQRINRGDLLSAVGNTGHSTGPHLHYEVRVNDVPVDPANYILEE